MSVAFCFPGQGSQDVGMGKAFAESIPGSRAVFEEASEAAGLDLPRLCFDGPIEDLTETEIQQPALVATSLACLRAVETLGVAPAVVVGHSVGEYSALGACNALSVSEAVALVRERGVATAAAAREQPGAMAALLGLPDAAVEELCAAIGDVWPANYNCPGQVVVSGRVDAVEELIAAATEQRSPPRRAAPRHRGVPQPARRVGREQATAGRRAGQLARAGRFVHVHRDGAIEGRERLAELLIEQLTAPVRFTQAVAALVERGVDLFVEVGPGQVLSGLIRRIDRSVTTLSVGDPASLAKLEEVLSTYD